MLNLNEMHKKVQVIISEVDPHGKVEILVRHKDESPFERASDEDDFLIGVDNVFTGARLEDLNNMDDSELQKFLYKAVFSIISGDDLIE